MEPFAAQINIVFVRKRIDKGFARVGKAVITVEFFNAAIAEAAVAYRVMTVTHIVVYPDKFRLCQGYNAVKRLNISVNIIFIRGAIAPDADFAVFVRHMAVVRMQAFIRILRMVAYGSKNVYSRRKAEPADFGHSLLYQRRRFLRRLQRYGRMAVWAEQRYAVDAVLIFAEKFFKCLKILFFEPMIARNTQST